MLNPPYKFKYTQPSSFVKDFYPTFETFITNHVDNSHLIQNEADYHELAHRAVCDNNLVILKYLVSLNKFPLDLPHLFKTSCSIGQLDCVRYLVHLGVDITVYDYDAFGWAANNNRFEVVKFLVETGIDLSTKNHLILCAAVERHDDIVYYLMDNKVYFDPKDIQDIQHLDQKAKNTYIDYEHAIRKKEFHEYLNQEIALISQPKIQPKI